MALREYSASEVDALLLATRRRGARLRWRRRLVSSFAVIVLGLSGAVALAERSSATTVARPAVASAMTLPRPAGPSLTIGTPHG